MNAELDKINKNKSFLSLDPRTKIFLLITVTTITCVGGKSKFINYINLFTVILPFIMLILSKKNIIAFKFLFVYLIALFFEKVIHIFFSGTVVVIVSAVAGIYLHILPGFVMGYYFIYTTKVSEFIAGMERLRITPKIVIPLSVVFRFFPTIREEYTCIKNAMKMRGIVLVKSPIKMLEYRLVPLMVSVTKIGEELTAAALTRGLSMEKRTNVCKIGFKNIDLILFIYAIFLWVGFVYYKIKIF